MLTNQSTFTLHRYLSNKADTSATGGRISPDIDNINLNIGLGICSTIVLHTVLVSVLEAFFIFFLNH